ncbi:hypothetical protein UlMin_041638 [Ulmus minor]
MQTTNVKKERVVLGRSLLDLVFSWSLKDVLNKDIYRKQVKQIPSTFYSTTEYLNSFVAPLIEETHADLFSSVISVSQSPFCEIKFFKQMKAFKTPKDLFYQLEVTGKNDTKTYEPESGDLIAITNVKPRCASDLGNSYIIAIVQGVKEEHVLKVSVLSSKPIIFEKEMDKNKKREPLFAVYLTNMTTNIRIWEALTCNPKERNMKIIEQVLQKKLFVEGKNCTLCQSKKIDNPTCLDVSLSIQSSDLNKSQKYAVLSCISTRDCSHRNTVKLIWGPPGTGKTKTVGFLLHSLLKLKCRTLTCGPTNIAVLEVTERLIRSVNESSMHDTYGLGDIVLFGNGERMKIDDRDDLLNVFLDYRLDILHECFHTTSGWEGSLRSMISLLEDPEKEYRSYLKDREVLDSEENDDDHNPENKNWEEGDNSEKLSKNQRNKRGSKQILSKALKENKKYNKKQQSKQKEKQSKHEEKKDGGKEQQENKKLENPLTFEEFLKKRVDSIVQRLHFCIVNLYTHLPTSHISLEVVEKMFSAVDSLLSFQMLLRTASNGVLRMEIEKDIENGNCFTAEYNVARYSTLLLLKSLTTAFPVPYTTDPYTDLRMTIKEFCLANAYLIFCTVSSSTKLHTKGMCPLELLVIDEAAQLKECESTIPLQLPGLRHAILVGDERQLPAMVQSKIADKADFGRSLFERLATLGHKKLLLNVQHRMHPSISLFPNREFYANQILDGPNVKPRSYNKSFLQGKMYGSYSFINVAHGKEQYDYKHSSKNLIEVAVVCEIVESLHKEVKRTKTKLRVGVISPYKAQVYEISDKIGHKYGSDAQSDFSVSVRSVDGFQGGEEDVIIISTVRSNGSGNIGFLSNRQRANVALTRARHCLWIVGNGATLGNSCSVWKKLVIDAKERNCFHNADEEKNLAYAITAALVELQQIHVLPNVDSLLFTNPRWKVCFTDAFWKSIAKAKSNELCKEVLSLLEKLSSGWRQHSKERQQVVPDGTLSQVVKHYKINKYLYLVWAVDILLENSHYIQILRALDILPLSDITKLTTQLDTLYGNYTVDKMNRCKDKSYEGNLVVPMRWPEELSSEEASDPVEFLSRPLASLSLRDKAGTSTTTYGIRNQLKSQKNRSHARYIRKH